MSGTYYVPEQSKWPFVGALGLLLLMVGAANLLHHNSWGYPFFLSGALLVSYMLFGWFRDVIIESMSGLYDAQMDRSFRWGMIWFIFSEAMFFGAFFGALFFVRVFAVPELGDTPLLWPDFVAQWPLLSNPNPELFVGPEAVIPPWGLPALNTLILLTSGATITWAHWALKLGRRTQLITGLLLTVLLGAVFLYFQVEEYIHAYHSLGLRLDSGIYGSTFFMLTGFHGAHVALGTFMLFVIALRCMKGHFSEHDHFAFEAVAWYWHFVDVVWLFLFVVVYWL